MKTCSPFGYRSKKSWDELFDIASRYGDVISIHTDPLWGGSFDLLSKARAKTSKPILAKGFHSSNSDVRQALICGADYVLCVGRLVPESLQDKVWVEPIDMAQLLEWAAFDIPLVWNQRDLNTGGRKTESFDDVRALRPAAACGHLWTCQASFISSPNDVHPTADAVLIGEGLETFFNVAESV